MSINRPPWYRAGFHASRPDPACPELVHAGESWWNTGKRIGWHVDDAWECWFQLEGVSCWRTADDDWRETEPDTLRIIPPGVRHAMRGDRARPQRFLYAGLDCVGVLCRLGIDVSAWCPGRWMILPGAAGVRPAFEELLHEVRTTRPHRHVGLRLAVERLVLAVERRRSGVPERSLLVRHRGVEQAMHLMDERPERAWPLAELARRTALSPNHLATVFSRQVGVPPHRYLLRLRIERARQMLEDPTVGVDEVARLVGFSSGQHLSRVFARQLGTTIRSWRRVRAGRSAGEATP